MISVVRALTYASAAFLAVVALTLLGKIEMDAYAFRVATHAAVAAAGGFVIADRVRILARIGYAPLRVVVFGLVVVLLSGMLLPIVGELHAALRTSTAPSLTTIGLAPLMGVFVIASAYHVVIPFGILASAVESAFTRCLQVPSNTSLERSRDR